MILCWIVQGYLLICIVRVIGSWLQLGETGGFLSAITMLCYTLTEPVFASLRKVLPVPGELPIDLAPLVVFLVLGLFRGLLC